MVCAMQCLVSEIHCSAIDHLRCWERVLLRSAIQHSHHRAQILLQWELVPCTVSHKTQFAAARTAIECVLFPDPATSAFDAKCDLGRRKLPWMDVFCLCYVFREMFSATSDTYRHQIPAGGRIDQAFERDLNLGASRSLLTPQNQQSQKEFTMMRIIGTRFRESLDETLSPPERFVCWPFQLFLPFWLVYAQRYFQEDRNLFPFVQLFRY